MKGIYQIRNVINNKIYIGSTNNFEKRFKTHFRNLNKQIHPNKYLQSAVNKYGLDNFKFEIVEELEDCLKLLEREQFYIDKYKNQLYNLTLIANSGGYDVLSKKCYILDLYGNISSIHESIMETSRYLKTHIYSPKVNTSQITKRKYRIVTEEFYNNHLELIKSWKSFPSESLERSKNYKLKQILIYNNKEYSSKKELSLELNISPERIRQILNNGSVKFNIQYKYPELNKLSAKKEKVS